MGFEPLEGRRLLAVTPEMLRDVSVVNGSDPTGIIEVSGTAYFAANDGTNGVELWKSDGTAAGTALVKDIFAGSGSSSPSSLVNVNGTLYFTANDGTNGVELWKSDGTAAGTSLVKDITPIGGYSAPAYLINVNGTLMFRANDGISGSELWKSDGTTAGTTRVKDILPGAVGSFFTGHPGFMENLGGTLFFTANDGSSGYEMWKSDGTAAGTVLVADINTTGSSDPSSAVVMGGAVYFPAYDGTNWGLWKTTGSGASLVKSNPSAPTFSAGRLTVVGSTLFFTSGNTSNGMEIWKSDGTTAGTVLVKTIASARAATYLPPELTAVGSTLFFQVNDGTHGNELWKSDGTAAGTQMVLDISSTAGGSRPNSLTNVGGTLFFSASGNLWKSDGSAGGTTLVKTINPGSTAAPAGIANINGTAMFRATEGSTGTELWKSNGTEAGTSLVKDINAQPSGMGSSVDGYVDVNGTTYFVANDSTHGSEIWKSDGTSAGTSLLKDIRPGAASSSVVELTNVNGVLYFTANDGEHGSELWKSDGTEAGTVLVKDIVAGSSSSISQGLRNVNGTLVFRANVPSSGYELWTSDGTEAGTTLLVDLRPGTASATPSQLVIVGSVMYFAANDGVNGAELWKTDGTEAGTVLVKDINSGALSSSPTYMANVNGLLYFSASNGVTGSELWKSDGTAAGTTLVADVRPGSASSSIKSMTAVGSNVFFTANDGTTGFELWTSDGTAAGTHLVKDIASGTSSSGPVTGGGPIKLTNVNGTLFFAASPSAVLTPVKLWKSDGTSAGTVQVKDVPADTTSTTNTFVNVNGLLYFSTRSDAPGGNELWSSDGTSVGTGQVIDINGSGNANLRALTNINGTLYFTATNPATGDEPWIMRPVTAGGPYTTSEGSSLTVTAGISGTGPYTYSWDLNGDGTFGDATGVSPTLSWAQLQALGIADGPSSYNARVRADDGLGHQYTSLATTVTVNNTAPTASISGPSTVLRGESRAFTLTASDPSTADQAAGFTFTIDWGDGSATETVAGPSGTVVYHAMNAAGSRSISVTATDTNAATGSAGSQAVQVDAAQLRTNADNLALQDLVWGGTSGDDQVELVQLIGTSVQVRQLKLNGETVSDVVDYSGVTGRVVALGRAGNDRLDARGLTSQQATLDGGANDNTLYGGAAGDLLIGGSNGGEGQQGNNIIIAGNGDNTIYGNDVVGAEGATGGNNLIIGGSGHDTIYGNFGSVKTEGGEVSDGGEGGRNVIVGGGGGDVIYASQSLDGAEGGQGSILVAGSTSLGESAMLSILSEWTSNRSFADRVANIGGTGTGPRSNGSDFLQVGTTLIDDGDTDELVSDSAGEGSWLLYSFGDDTADRVKTIDEETDV